MTAKAIVTGGNGYIGSALVRELLRLGVEVHAIANRNLDKLSVLLPAGCIYPIGNDWHAVSALVKKLKPQVIYHLASVYSEPPTPDETIAIVHCDIMLGTTLLQAACDCEPRPALVNLGTYWQFGDEANASSPNTLYAAAKQAMHDILLYFCTIRGIRAVTLVLYDIFGPGDPRPKLWTKLAQAADGSSFPVTEGRQYIELVHVDDVIRAILMAADQLTQMEPMQPLYALPSQERVTLRKLLEAVRERTGLDIHFEWGAVPYSPSQIFTPWSGECLPGWRPIIPPVEGIAKLIADAAALKQPREDLPVKVSKHEQ